MKAIDPVSVTQILRGYLPDSLARNVTVRDRDIKLTRSHESELCVCYHLRREDGLNDSRLPRILYGKIFLDGPTDRHEIRPLSSLLSFPDPPGRHPGYVPELDMFLWPFPYDPTLVQLPQLCEADRLGSLIPYQDIQQDAGKWEHSPQITIQPISYHPENRCSIRYELRVGTQPGFAQATIYGKTFSDDRGRHLYNRLRSLWEWAQRDPDAFLVPYPYHYDETVKTVWTEALAGRALIDVISQENFLEFMGLVAKSLASFHRSRLSLPPGSEVDVLLEKFKRKTVHIVQALPSVKDDLTSVLAELEPLPLGLARRDSTPVHGTFRIEELLSCRGRIGTCDLDNCCLGDPLQDLASFIVDLHFSGLAPELRNDIGAAFFRAYQGLADDEVPVSHFIWYYRLRLLRKACWIFAKQLIRPGAERRILKVLNLAKLAPTFASEILLTEPALRREGAA